MTFQFSRVQLIFVQNALSTLSKQWSDEQWTAWTFFSIYASDKSFVGLFETFNRSLAILSSYIESMNVSLKTLGKTNLISLQIHKKLFKQIFDEIIGKGEFDVDCIERVWIFVLFEFKIYRKVCVRSCCS